MPQWLLDIGSVAGLVTAAFLTIDGLLKREDLRFRLDPHRIEFCKWPTSKVAALIEYRTSFAQLEFFALCRVARRNFTSGRSQTRA